MIALARLLSRPAVVFLSLLSPTLAADWPTDRGDNARTGATDEVLSMPLHAAWSIKAPAAPHLAWSSGEGRVVEGKLLGHRIRFDDAFRTVVSEGRMYFGSTVDHQVHCIDLSSGRELWTYFTGNKVTAILAIHRIKRR
jgi:outer membrane protein assembly factor BamB